MPDCAEAVEDLVLWESLAILEYLVELFSDLWVWPADAADRVRGKKQNSGRAPAIIRVEINIKTPNGLWRRHL